MKLCAPFLVFVAIAFYPLAGATADETEPLTERIAVTVNQSNPIDSLDQDQLKRVFLSQQLRWPDGTTITVFERHSSNLIREQFSHEILGKAPGEYRQYWLNLRMTKGLKAPKSCRSAALVREYLKRVKGGIGYMYEAETNDDVKVVAIITVETDG